MGHRQACMQRGLFVLNGSNSTVINYDAFQLLAMLRGNHLKPNSKENSTRVHDTNVTSSTLEQFNLISFN